MAVTQKQNVTMYTFHNFNCSSVDLEYFAVNKYTTKNLMSVQA